MLLVPSALNAMLGLNLFAVRAGIFVVIHFAVCGRIFR
jgi:hypothetical protein